MQSCWRAYNKRAYYGRSNSKEAVAGAQKDLALTDGNARCDFRPSG